MLSNVSACVICSETETAYAKTYAQANSITFEVCDGHEISSTNVTGVIVAPASKTLKVGETATLVVTVIPETAVDKTVTWSSSNNAVATVSSAGVINAVEIGTANIKVTANDETNGTFTNTCIVTVKEDNVDSIAIKTEPSKKNYITGNTLDTAGLSIELTYENGTKATKTSGFSCSPNVLNTAGTQTITVTYGGKTCTYNVTVADASAIYPTITIANLNNSASINCGDSLKLTAVTTDKPAGAKIVWSVQGTGVSLKASEDGTTCEVTSVDNGTVTVTAKIVDASGNPITDADSKEISASQQIKSNAGFFQKLIAFFKKLFGLTKTIVQSIDE